jgi:protein SCO1
MKPVPCLAVLLGLAVLGPAFAEEPARSAAHQYFTDTELIDQDGRPMRLYSDLIHARSVVINTFFTTCTGICPPLNQRMAQIQERLGDRLGKDVYLLSISVDPTTDTPPRLKEYAARYRAKPGWFFLTGRKDNVDFVLRKLGERVEAPDDHTSVLIIGNDRTELWKKARGLASTEEVLQVVESVVNER